MCEAGSEAKVDCSNDSSSESSKSAPSQEVAPGGGEENSPSQGDPKNFVKECVSAVLEDKELLKKIVSSFNDDKDIYIKIAALSAKIIATFSISDSVINSIAIAVPKIAAAVPKPSDKVTIEQNQTPDHQPTTQLYDLLDKIVADVKKRYCTPKRIFWFSTLSSIVAGLVLGLILTLILNTSKIRNQLDGVETNVHELSQKLDDSAKAPKGASEKQVADLDAKMSEIRKNMDKAAKEINQMISDNSQAKPTSVSNQEIQHIASEVRKVIEDDKFVSKLGEKVQAKLKPGVSESAMKPEKLQESVRAALDDKELFDKIAAAVQKQVKALPPQSPPGMATADGLKELRAAWKTDADELRKKLAELDKKLAEATKPTPQQSEPLDVIVVSTHSQQMSAEQLSVPCKRLFATVKGDLSERYRLGFYVAVTAKLQKKIALKDGKASDDSFFVAAPTGNETERPESIGPDLLDEFDVRHPRQRCILVASARCTAPSPEAEGWKNIPCVDVLLVRAKGKAEAAALAPWLDFCAARHGSLTVLAVNEASVGKKEFEDQLYENLLRLAQPSRR